MPRPAKRTAPQRNEELIHAAAKLFRERGYDATSMQEIADEMGILKGSVYHYVKTKEDLLWMVVEPVLTRLVEQAEEIFAADGDYASRLRKAMINHAVSFEQNSPHMFVITRENGDTLSDKRREDVVALRSRYYNIWRDAIIAGQKKREFRKDIDSAIAVHGIFGMLNWMFRWFRVDGKASAESVAEQFADMVLDGLVKR